jgi:hypothetical protein
VGASPFMDQVLRRLAIYLAGWILFIGCFLIQFGLLWSSFDFILQWGCFEETGLVMIDLQQIETLSKYKIGGRFINFNAGRN